MGRAVGVFVVAPLIIVAVWRYVDGADESAKEESLEQSE